MSVPLGKGDAGCGGPAPTEYQLRLARVRAAATGESLSRVLAVFAGVGRHGEEADGPRTGPEASTAHGPPGPAADQEADGPGRSASGRSASGRSAAGRSGSERLAPVIPLTRAARRTAGDGGAPGGGAPHTP